MPRLTEEYRAARRQQVVDAARRCFTRTGFHATSMQDVFTESGLSAGAVYGYFASKEALVAAIVDEVVAEITAGFDEVLGAAELPPITEVLQQLFTVVDKQDGRREFAALVVQVWAEAVRNPVLGAVLAEKYRDFREGFTRIVRRYQQEGLLDPAAKPGDVARVLTTFGPAFLFQQALLDGVGARAFSNGLRPLLQPPV
ncbi:TetR/AcrR family transcriptional regulator [Nocardia mexicana]|uniref:TetR family transcriptional regulator n=1 Tax=Nocardia mexicana TaxID=279262 RepID=A0A370H9I8_9NOCA|nr:TetR/AcrR family transcriptional regulator [Nocardia mexicana]RDI52900.1 TetR family transcriptional regulator [Nocardia mexicana]